MAWLRRWVVGTRQQLGATKSESIPGCCAFLSQPLAAVSIEGNLDELKAHAGGQAAGSTSVVLAN